MDFDSFAETQLMPLLRLAWAITGGDRALGEDLVQDVMIKVQGRWPAISQMDDPLAYVKRMVVNQHVSFRRKWSRQLAQADISRHQPVADVAEQIATSDALRKAIQGLPVRQRTIIALRYFADMDDAEIATMMGCRQTTVRSHASRGIARLRQVSLANVASEQSRS